jgi:tetratricopeptide (TPR) repeat protein
MPADVQIETHDDGAVTVWLSEHDPMARMKGMHGVCVRPGRSIVELRARVSNRTDDVQTFLWWANAATRVHEHYQSFFPPDVRHVADHAKRAVSSFPLCTGRYYGVDYGERARSGVPAEEQPPRYQPPRTRDGHPAYPPNDLSWYANIPVPTSYMAAGSSHDFFGGYDHKAEAGLIHVADHRIAPGKKQWTWGNQEFGYAWDRNLTDPDERGEYAPYIELMAGVFTDNQPDFSFLQPGETRTWSQFWYPFQAIGPARHATVDGAVSVQPADGRALRIGVTVTAVHANATVRVLASNGREAKVTRVDLSPSQPWVETVRFERGIDADSVTVIVERSDGGELLACRPQPTSPGDTPSAATEPPSPSKVGGSDELYLIGLHLEQYRHATRCPTAYWQEALRRDAGDSRSNLALGRWHLRRGEFDAAERHLRASIARLTSRNPNPSDGEAFYQLGRCLRYQQQESAAYDAFAKAAWNQAWAGASHHAMAEICARREDWDGAFDHLERCLVLNQDHSAARNLKAVALRRLGRADEARTFLTETVARDPLDWWARHLRGGALSCDSQVSLDVAWDYARAGLLREALKVLDREAPGPLEGTDPILSYLRAWLCEALNDSTASRQHLAAARKANRDYCFPSRLEEFVLLQWVVTRSPDDALAHQLLGFWLYDRRRHEEAMRHWETAVRLEPFNGVVWRCLGIAAFNQRRNANAARRAYDRALEARPDDARLLYEQDQLWKRIGVAPARRLRTLAARRDLVEQRDDLVLEFCALLNHAQRAPEVRDIMRRRRFQPWEGGEGNALAQHVRTQIALGRAALEAGDAQQAREEFERALVCPENLGEARHPLANPSEILFWLGEACAAAGDKAAARQAWQQAARSRGDFQGMAVRAYSEMSYFTALALSRLGRASVARQMLRGMIDYARRLRRQPAVVDYFATSLPTMLLFHDDLDARQRLHADLLEALAHLGLGKTAPATRLLRDVLAKDPAHALANDLLRSPGTLGSGRRPDGYSMRLAIGTISASRKPRRAARSIKLM